MFHRGRHDDNEALLFDDIDGDRCVLRPVRFTAEVRISPISRGFLDLDRDRAGKLAVALRHFADTGEFPWHLADGGPARKDGAAADAVVDGHAGIEGRLGEIEGRLGSLERVGARDRLDSLGNDVAVARHDAAKAIARLGTLEAWNVQVDDRLDGLERDLPVLSEQLGEHRQKTVEAFGRSGGRLGAAEAKLKALESSRDFGDIGVTGLELRVEALERAVGDAGRVAAEDEIDRLNREFPVGSKVSYRWDACDIWFCGHTATPFFRRHDGSPMAGVRCGDPGTSGGVYYASDIKPRG